MASRHRTQRNGSNHDGFMTRNLDDLAEYDAIAGKLLPELRKLLATGYSAQEIYQRYSPFAAARAVMTVVSDPDSSKALAASKDILDRALGKARERSEVTHRFAQMRDEQLDALILSELGALDDSET